jgi:hypothetical protein
VPRPQLLPLRLHITGRNAVTPAAGIHKQRHIGCWGRFVFKGKVRREHRQVRWLNFGYGYGSLDSYVSFLTHCSTPEPYLFQHSIYCNSSQFRNRSKEEAVMQTMHQYILPSPTLTASYPVEDGEASPTSPATNRTLSWSMVSCKKSKHNAKFCKFSSFFHC